MDLKLIITSLILLGQAVTLNNSTHEVIIIGAGIAGLRASQILARDKIPHLILQATDHIGGRITSIDFEGIKLDKGASFIHNSQSSNPLGQLFRHLGWPWVNATYTYDIIYRENLKSNLFEQHQIVQARKMYFKIVRIIDKRLKKQRTMMKADVLKRLIRNEFPKESQLRRGLVAFMLFIEDCIDGSQIQNLQTKIESYNEAKYDLYPLSGLNQVFSSLFTKIEGQILFNKKVTAIDYTNQLIKVQTNNQTYYAKKVVTSFPIGVLKAKKIKFLPNLPQAYQRVIQNIGVSVIDKLFVSFQRPFWSNNTGWISFLKKNKPNKYPVAFIMPSTQANILLFFVTGQDSLTISEWSREKLVTDLQNFLALFHKKSNIWIKNVFLTKWHQDQNQLGSYSKFTQENNNSDFPLLSEPIQDRIWFIGEHSHPNLNSYAHGAYLSGENAAEEVIESLRQDQ